MTYKGYFFDFDYTLADSGDAIALCFQMLFQAHGITGITDAQIKATIGYTWAQGTTMLTGITDPDVLERYRQEYVAYADECMAANTRLFPSAKEVLERIKEKQALVYIVSNKAGSRIMETVRMYDLDVDGVIGGEAVVQPKPAPEGLQKAIEKSGLDKSCCVYVGDSHIDALTAQNAGVDFIGVTTGTTLAGEFEKYPFVKIIEDLKQLEID